MKEGALHHLVLRKQLVSSSKLPMAAQCFHAGTYNTINRALEVQHHTNLFLPRQTTAFPSYILLPKLSQIASPWLLLDYKHSQVPG